MPLCDTVDSKGNDVSTLIIFGGIAENGGILRSTYLFELNNKDFSQSKAKELTSKLDNTQENMLTRDRFFFN